MTHGISGFSSSPGVAYAADCSKKLILSTISSKTEYQPRPGREQDDSDPSLSIVGTKSPDNGFYKVETSTKVPSAILLNTS